MSLYWSKPPIRPTYLMTLLTRQNIHMHYGDIDASWVQALMNAAYPGQRQYDPRPVSAIQHFIGALV